MKRKLQGAFDGIRADAVLQQRTLDYVRTKRAGASRALPLAAAMACLVLLLGGCGVYFTPTAYVAVDVNPSVELRLNCFDTVVSARGMNDDGAALLETVELRRHSCAEAMELIFACTAVQRALEEGGEVSVSLDSGGAQQQRLMACMKECSEQHPQTQWQSVEKEEAAAAREVGLSCEKYRLWLQLQQQGSEITAQQAGQLSMKELRQLLEDPGESGGEGSCAQKGHGQGGGGNGHHKGNGA